MTLEEEYLNCITKYEIVNDIVAGELLDNLRTNINFHVGGRIDINKNKNCREFYSLEELKKYFNLLKITENEKITLIPFIYTTPTIRTSLEYFYDCFYDCLAACSDVWMIFDNYNLVIEFNHDDEIIGCFLN